MSPILAYRLDEEFFAKLVQDTEEREQLIKGFSCKVLLHVCSTMRWKKHMIHFQRIKVLPEAFFLIQKVVKFV